MRNKQYTLALATLLGGSLSAQQAGAHFATDAIQSTFHNPSRLLDHRVTVSLFGISGQGYSSSLRGDQLFREQGDQLFLEPEAALNALETTGNYLEGQQTIQSLAVAVRAGDKLQFSLSHQVHNFQRLTFPAALARLAWEGNASVLGEQVELAPSLDLFSYNDIALGAAVQATEQLQLGLRAH